MKKMKEKIDEQLYGKEDLKKMNKITEVLKNLSYTKAISILENSIGYLGTKSFVG